MPKNNLVSFNDTPPKGKDVKSTAMLEPGAREKFATGTNTTKRHTASHKPYGKGGAKGHPD